jgi:nitrogen regulatory protein PII
MKKIEAYIKPGRLTKVTMALHKIDAMSGMTVLDAKGFGKLPLQDIKSPGDFRPQVKLEIICPDELCQEIVDCIEKSAHTGLRGDGRIFVSAIEQALRISTGEKS